MSIWQLRFRLAKAIAPCAIMPDPYPGDGAFVVLRQGIAAASYRMDKVDISTEIAPIDDFHDPFERRRRVTRFSGEAAA